MKVVPEEFVDFAIRCKITTNIIRFDESMCLSYPLLWITLLIEIKLTWWIDINSKIKY